MLWVHPLTNGIFFGATAVNVSDAKQKKMGVWFASLFSTSLLVATGESLLVAGENRTVKTITKPAGTGAIAGHTRVGNNVAIQLLIKTVDGGIYLRPFDAP